MVFDTAAYNKELNFKLKLQINICTHTHMPTQAYSIPYLAILQAALAVS